jgi:hypothetical protein
MAKAEIMTTPPTSGKNQCLAQGCNGWGELSVICRVTLRAMNFGKVGRCRVEKARVKPSKY